MNPLANKDTRRVALLVSCATGMQLAENCFPQPLPGLKLGLANLITLIALVNLGFCAALEIALLRALISALILGTFLSSGFLLSLVGALVSTLVMGLLYRFAALVRLSLVGISVAGALAHCLAQIALVFLLLIRHPGVFVLLPWLVIGAVVTGWIIGLVAAQVCRTLHSDANLGSTRHSSILSKYPGPLYIAESGIQSAPQVLLLLVKIVVVLVFALVSLLVKSFWSFAVLFVCLVVMTRLARIPARHLLRALRRLTPLLLFAFVIPGCFIHAGDPLFRAGPMVITRDALLASAVFASRMVLLMLGASLLTTSAPEEQAAGLMVLLCPLKWCGVRTERIAAIMANALSALPTIREESHRAIQAQNFRGKRIRDLPLVLATLIATLCGEALVPSASDQERWP